MTDSLDAVARLPEFSGGTHMAPGLRNAHAELTMSPRPRRDDDFMRTLGAGDVLGARKLYPLT